MVFGADYAGWHCIVFDEILSWVSAGAVCGLPLRKWMFITLHASKAVAQCIEIGPVCVFVGMLVCLRVCYHNNSKLRASILTKLGLQVKVVTISS